MVTVGFEEISERFGVKPSGHDDGFIRTGFIHPGKDIFRHERIARFGTAVEFERLIEKGIDFIQMLKLEIADTFGWIEFQETLGEDGRFDRSGKW